MNKALCEKLLNIADIVLYQCDIFSPGKLIIPESVADFFQSDDFLEVGRIARGEEEDEVPGLCRAISDLEAENRALKAKILKYEEMEGHFKSTLAMNDRLIKRIEELKHG